MPSIHLRLLLAVTLALVAFLGLGSFALDKAFSDSLERAAEERLLGHVYALLGAAKTDTEGRMRLPGSLPDPRFSNPDSGLYAWVLGEDGSYRWHSLSMVGRSVKPLEVVKAGSHSFSYEKSAGESFYLLVFGLLWEDDAGNELSYSFAIAENDAAIQAQVSTFRESLLIWLGGVSVILIMLQGLVLSWGLRPLRQVSSDLKRIESGQVDQLKGRYPKELQGLTGNINSLIRSGLASQERYRNSLGDLAHSLKTPLAVLQGAAEGDDATALTASVNEQVSRMNDIVQYQLKRAAASGRQGLAQITPVAVVVNRLLRTLEKVYLEKQISCISEVDGEIVFPGDEGDLMELLGNLLENAFKYGRSKVRVRAEVNESASELQITIDDDGPGIPESERQNVLNRGRRADERQPGQGIGLSVSDQIIRLYGGGLRIGSSELGGNRIILWLPL